MIAIQAAPIANSEVAVLIPVNVLPLVSFTVSLSQVTIRLRLNQESNSVFVPSLIDPSNNRVHRGRLLVVYNQIGAAVPDVQRWMTKTYREYALRKMLDKVK